MTRRLYCTDCLEDTEAVEETFDYAGTHCTHGRAGTEHTGHFVSKCCGAELVEDPSDLLPEGWSCWLDVKPIPIRDHDWDFSHDNYDGADGGNGLAGTGASIRDCLEQIKEIEEERDLYGDDGDDWDAERRENAELEGNDDRGELL